MKQEHKNLCEDILQGIALRHGIKILELSGMPDHVHAVVAIPLAMSVSKALQLLKGGSSYALFQKSLMMPFPWSSIFT